MPGLLDLPFELLRLILNHQENRNDTNALIQTCRFLYLTFNDFLYQYDLEHCNRSALFWAARTNVAATAARSLKAGPYSDVWNENDHTPFSIAAARGHVDIMGQLLEFAGRGLDLETRTLDGRTALSHAACFGQTGAAKLLLKHGAKLDTENVDKMSPLILAAVNSHHETVKTLFDHGAALEVKDRGGRTAFAWAAASGNLEAVEFLLKKGAVLESRTATGGTPLILAVRKGHEAVVRRLLEAGADPNARTANGMTVLHHSQSYTEESVVRLLLEAGSDPRATTEIRDDLDNVFRTPADLVGLFSIYRLENEAVYELLKAAEAREW